MEKRRKKTPVVPWMHDHYGEETAGNTSTSNNAVQPEYRYENTGNMNNAGNMNNTGNQSNRTNNTVFCEPKYVWGVSFHYSSQ